MPELLDITGTCIEDAVRDIVDHLDAKRHKLWAASFGDPAAPVLVVVALDGNAHRLREALTEYLAWPCPALPDPVNR